MFTIRNYASDERYDLAKFINFKGDVYDVLDSPFLAKLKELPVSSYYYTSQGSKNIDQISSETYGTPFMSFYIQYFNDINTEVLPEGVKLNLFNMSDFDSLYYQIANGDV